MPSLALSASFCYCRKSTNVHSQVFQPINGCTCVSGIGKIPEPRLHTSCWLCCSEHTCLQESQNLSCTAITILPDRQGRFPPEMDVRRQLCSSDFIRVGNYQLSLHSHSSSLSTCNIIYNLTGHRSQASLSCAAA